MGELRASGVRPSIGPISPSKSTPDAIGRDSAEAMFSAQPAGVIDPRRVLPDRGHQPFWQWCAPARHTRESRCSQAFEHHPKNIRPNKLGAPRCAKAGRRACNGGRRRVPKGHHSLIEIDSEARISCCGDISRWIGDRRAVPRSTGRQVCPEGQTPRMIGTATAWTAAMIRKTLRR